MHGRFSRNSVRHERAGVAGLMPPAPRRLDELIGERIDEFFLLRSATGRGIVHLDDL